MCGILVSAGLRRPTSHRDLASLRPRGPDGIGFWCDPHVTMAQTRLAIIGLTERVTGPLEDDSHVLAYNGEIYNFEDIRSRLKQVGVSLAEANDSEVLLHAWTRWGAEVLKELHGFWAFVVYDKVRRTLTLVRDQFGVKPLYYYTRGREVCVATTLRTVLEGTNMSPTLNFEALSEYAAYQFTFGDKTFVEGVHKVLPGHIVEIDLSSGHVVSRAYEDIFALAADEPVAPDGDWVAETRSLLSSCILQSTLADVPFATLCSGGIDSSLVTRITRPELAYHCNYSDPECNETFFAKQAVEGTSTRLYVVNASESFNLVNRLASIIDDFDDPTVGSVVLPLDELLARVGQRHRVVLTGTGGDELFGGYVRYQLALGVCLQDSYRGMFDRLQAVPVVADRFEMCHRKGRVDYFRFYDEGVETTFRKSFEECRQTEDDGDAMVTFDRRHFLAALLNIDDRIAGRHAIEGRPSLLHQRFVRHVCRVRPSDLLQGELKGVFRSIAAPLLPPAIARRTDKMGFTTPIGVFAQRSWDRIREQLMSSPFKDLYDLTHFTARSDDKFSREVFGLLMVDLWLNRYAA